MATKEQHAAKADNNVAFAKSIELKSQVNIDWALTALFYSGVHYVDAYLVKKGTLPHLYDTHAKREKMIETDSSLRTVKNEYYDLKHFGMNARYFCNITRADKVTGEALPALEAIQKHIKGKL